MIEIKPVLKKQDRIAAICIGAISIIVFIAVVILSKIKVEVNLGFNVHQFAKLNAMINCVVSILLVAGVITVKGKRFLMHRHIMLTAIVLSIIFLLSYICHHLFADSTAYEGHGPLRYFYLVVLISHIVLAAIVLPFILYTAYRALTGEYERHKKLTRITFPIWLYVSISGVIVYVMISPYYQ
jgi:putative membrane protein